MAEVEMLASKKAVEDAEAGLIEGDGGAAGQLDSSAAAGPACVCSTILCLGGLEANHQTGLTVLLHTSLRSHPPPHSFLRKPQDGYLQLVSVGRNGARHPERWVSAQRIRFSFDCDVFAGDYHCTLLRVHEIRRWCHRLFFGHGCEQRLDPELRAGPLLPHVSRCAR